MEELLDKEKNTTGLKKRNKKNKYIVLGIFIVLMSAYLIWGNTSLQTTVYEVNLLVNDENLDGFTIVQISDLHNAEFGKEQSRLIEEIRKQEPDIIAVTGDLIDSSHTNVETAMTFIEDAVLIAPVYYVTGNHEGWVESLVYEKLKIRMLEAGVHILEDESEVLLYENTSLNIVGVQDPDMPGNNVVLTKNTINDLLEQTEGYTVLLSHRPELFDKYVEGGADLVLSGHAHGGQFRIPFIGGVVAPDQGLFPKYTEGIFTENGTTMVVSRGLGNSVVPVRINNRPEIVVVRLVGAE